MIISRSIYVAANALLFFCVAEYYSDRHVVPVVKKFGLDLGTKRNTEKSIPLYICAPSCLFIHLLMDIEGISMS